MAEDRPTLPRSTLGLSSSRAVARADAPPRADSPPGDAAREDAGRPESPSGDAAPQGSAPRAAAPSPRARLARLAGEAALGAPGVVALSTGPGGQWVAADRGERLTGVGAAARSDGRYDVRVAVTVAEPTRPLGELAEAIRERLVAAAGDEGLAAELGAVDVAIADIVSREEEEREEEEREHAADATDGPASGGNAP